MSDSPELGKDAIDLFLLERLKNCIFILTWYNWKT